MCMKYWLTALVKLALEKSVVRYTHLCEGMIYTLILSHFVNSEFLQEFYFRE